MVYRLSDYIGWDCFYTELYLETYGEGILKPVENKYLNVSFYVLLSNNTSLLVDTLIIPIKASIIPVTPTPMTITMKPGETTPQIQYTGKPYIVGSKNKYFEASLLKETNGDIKLTISNTKYIKLSINTSKLIVKINSNADGELHLSSTIRQKCIITTYLEKPLTIPKTHYTYQTIHITHFEPRSLITSLILIIIGFMILQTPTLLLLWRK
jgi:hypothetical protein